MLDNSLIMPCFKDPFFKADNSLYRFHSEENLALKATYIESWHNHVGFFQEEKEVLDWKIKHVFEGISDFVTKQGEGTMHPMLFDKHNCDLYDMVRPINWTDPDCQVRNPHFIYIGLIRHACHWRRRWWISYCCFSSRHGS